MQPIAVKYHDVMELIEGCTYNTRQDYKRCIEDLIRKKPFGNRKFYIYSIFKDTEKQGVKRLIHQPRLTRPEPVHGTTLLRVDPATPTEMQIVWTLPDKENFDQYKDGKLHKNKTVQHFIDLYRKNRSKLMETDEHDLSDDEIRAIYVSLKAPTSSKN